MLLAIVVWCSKKTEYLHPRLWNVTCDLQAGCSVFEAWEKKTIKLYWKKIIFNLIKPIFKHWWSAFQGKKRGICITLAQIQKIKVRNFHVPCSCVFILEENSLFAPFSVFGLPLQLLSGSSEILYEAREVPISNSFKSIFRSFHIVNFRQLFRTSGPHQIQCTKQKIPWKINESPLLMKQVVD